MTKLTKTAKNLDTFFKVLGILIKICMVVMLAALGVIAAGFLFDLDPYTIGTGYQNLEFCGLTLELAPAYAPDEHFVLILVAVGTSLAFICLMVMYPCVSCIRDILKPMTEGAPFHSSVSENLKKLAKRSIVVCILVNCMEIFTTVMFLSSFDLPGLLVGEKITHITYNAQFDLTFLIVAAVLYLLSYIFRYGEELQQLSDETL